MSKIATRRAIGGEKVDVIVCSGGPRYFLSGTAQAWSGDPSTLVPCDCVAPILRAKMEAGDLVDIAVTGDSYAFLSDVLINPITASLGATGVAYSSNGGPVADIDADIDYAALTNQDPCAIFATGGANDWFRGVTPAQYSSDLKVYIANLQAAAPNAEIVFLIQPQLILNPGGNPVAPWAAYAAEAVSCMKSLGVDYVFISPPIPASDGATGPSGLWADNAHPNEAGGELFASHLLELIQC